MLPVWSSAMISKKEAKSFHKRIHFGIKASSLERSSIQRLHLDYCSCYRKRCANEETMNHYFNRIGRRSRSSNVGSTSNAYLAPPCKASTPSSGVDPELLRYIISPATSATLRLRSPTTLKSAPMRFEEEVIVMDGILMNYNKNIWRDNPLSELSSVVNNRVLVMDDLLISKNNSPGNGRKFNSSARNNSAASDLVDENWKKELCISWMEIGLCKFGSKCHFAHGNEELRGGLGENRTWKHKPEAIGDIGSKLHRSSPPPGPKTLNPYLSSYPSPVEIKKTKSKAKHIPAISSMPTLSTTFNWPPIKEENERITLALYGPMKARLPVFQQICPQ